MDADITSQAVGLASNTDFSIISLFIRADIIVKSVIIILIVSSIYSWAIIFEKFRMFKKINKSAEEFEEKFWKSKSAESFYNSLNNKEKDPMANIFQSAMVEVIKTKSKSVTLTLSTYILLLSCHLANKDHYHVDHTQVCLVLIYHKQFFLS